MIRGYHHCAVRQTVRYGKCLRCDGHCRDAREDVERLLDHCDTAVRFLLGVIEQSYVENDFNTNARVSIAAQALDELCSSIGGPDWRRYGLPVADADG